MIKLACKMDRSNILIIRQRPERDISLFKLQNALFGNVMLQVIGIRISPRNCLEISRISQAPDGKYIDLEIPGRFICGKVADEFDLNCFG